MTFFQVLGLTLLLGPSIILLIYLFKSRCNPVVMEIVLTLLVFALFMGFVVGYPLLAIYLLNNGELP